MIEVQCDGSDLTNFGTWLLDNGDRLFRYWVYKKMFTPYEQANEFVDESEFEDTTANHGYIEEAIELPDGDVLLGIRDANIEEYIEYYKLSEIRLAYMPSDKSLKEDEDGDL